MFSIFKTLSWTVLVSALGYTFIDFPETVYFLVNPNEYQAQMDNSKAAFDEMNARDQLMVQRNMLKNLVSNAFKQQEISIYQAASCFQTLMLYSNDKNGKIPHGHENYTSDIRACLSLLLWLDDPALKGNNLEVVVNDFRNIVNIAKNGCYQIELPLPPAKLLAEYLY
ncbi:MAG: hypothetical protein NTV50_02895 [Planctomycetota bacterium]|nr:hypothetical protein [Planctomycetota bacterium]